MSQPQATTPVRFEAWNHFDEFGLLLGLPRLEGESNFYYRNRLKDVGDHVPGASKNDLRNAISRGLSMKPYYDAITINMGTSGDDEGNPLIDPTAVIEIADLGIYYDADTLKVQETHTVDPVTITIDLNEIPRYAEDITIVHDSEEILRDGYELGEQRIRFLDASYASESVTVTYNYRKLFSFYSGTDYRTLSELKADIDAFTVGGYKRMVMTYHSKHDDTSAAYMQRSSSVELTTDSLTLNLYQFNAFELHDEDLQELYYNSYGHAYDTKLEGWAREIALNASIMWGNCILDRDEWDVVGRRYLGVLPHLYDNVCVRCYPRDRSSTVYNYQEYRHLGGVTENGKVNLDHNGVTTSEFKSGIGHSDHLKVVEIVEV